MNESALYNESDLAPFHRRLNELRQIVQQDSKQPKALTKLLERQLHECGMSSIVILSSSTFSFHLDAIVNQLQESLSVLSPELLPVHQKLVTIRRQLVALAAKEGSQKAELKPLQEELRRIDSLSTSPLLYRLFPSPYFSETWPFLLETISLTLFASLPQLDRHTITQQQNTRRWQIPRSRRGHSCIPSDLFISSRRMLRNSSGN